MTEELCCVLFEIQAITLATRKGNRDNTRKIDEFIPATGDRTQYIERINHFFIANDISKKRRNKAILLSLCGTGTHRLLRKRQKNPTMN